MSSPAQSTSPSPDRTTWRLPQLEHWIVVPLIVILTIGTLGRIVSFTPEVGALESQVLAALEPVRSGLALSLAGVLHGLFSAPWVLGVIAALTAWLAVIRRHGRDAAGFAVTSTVAVLTATAVQQIVGRPSPSAAQAALAADAGSSLPSVAVCSVLAISLAFLVASRRHASGTLILVAGAVLAVLTGAAALLTSAAYPLDVLLALPVAWAGVVLGCGVANTAVPAMAERFGWGASSAERKLAHRMVPRYSDAETAIAPRTGASPATPVAGRRHIEGPITEEIPVIHQDDAAA